MEKNDKPRHLDAIKWLRDHINRERTYPSIDDIAGRLFAVDNDISMNVMIDEMQKQTPSSHFFRRELSNLLYDRIGGLMKMAEAGKPAGPPPKNWTLTEGHRDRTDQYGYPYYWPSDDKGNLKKDFDENMLSVSKHAQRCRMMYGVQGKLYHEGSLDPLDRVKLPKPTKEQEREENRLREKYKIIEEVNK